MAAAQEIELKFALAPQSAGAKKLRYASAFFAGLFVSGRSRWRRKKFIARLKALQGAHGGLNDLVVHRGLAQRTIAPHRAGGARATLEKPSPPVSCSAARRCAMPAS